jgi:uncharacterized protein (TIGR03067 family)
MRSIAKLAMLAATALGAATAPTLADEPKGDLAKLQGTWTSMSGPNKDIPRTLTIRGNTVEFRGKLPNGTETILKGELKLDEGITPKSVDFVKLKTRFETDMADTPGIYKLEEDTWITCGGGPGGERPTKFEPGLGDNDLPRLVTWTRVKDKVDEKPIKGDLAKFQGSWLAPAGDNDEVIITMTVKVNAYTASWDSGDGTKVELKGELRVNEKATPNKTIDYFNTQRNDGEDARDNLGIYEIDGDKIKVCVGAPGAERPTEFKKGEGGSIHLLIFTRKKE